MAGKDQDKEKQRDWDRELAEVDKLLAKLPTHEPPRPGGGAGAGGAVPTARLAAPPPAARSGATWLGTWTKVGLAFALAIGLTQWPYTTGCGIRLIFYLLAVGTLLVTGVWASISSWRGRMGLAHILSQGLIVWGLVLAAREVLPRAGYAAASATWLCASPPTPSN